MNREFDVGFLVGLHRGGRSEELVLDVLADQSPDDHEIGVKELVESVNLRVNAPEEMGVPRRNVTRVLRALDQNGFGRLIPGRSERYPSRFVSQAPLSQIGLAATGGLAAESLAFNADTAPPEVNKRASDWQRLIVRSGWAIELPADLSRTEAERLIKLIENLPTD
ncbi:MAG: hypothetical protein RJP95_01130 [Pirellulales bacterium]